MDKIEVYFQDGTTKSYPQGVLARDLLADDQGPGRSDEVVSAKINATLVDLQAPLEQGGKLEWVGLPSIQGTEVLRHSTSHVMAQAVQSLFPNAKITIGPAIKDGFYYDFDCERSFSPEDFHRIEGKMQEIIKKDLPIVRQEVSREEALRFFRERGEIYKVELIEKIADSKVTLYQQGEFVDLCRGPHLPSTGMIKAFKLTSVAGAYWHGDERNKMLQRIYGTAFPSAAALEKHLLRLEEARRRDHRKLGRELDLFSINDEAGAGLVIYHPSFSTAVFCPIFQGLPLTSWKRFNRSMGGGISQERPAPPVSLHQFSISTWASSSVVKIAPLTLEVRVCLAAHTEVAPE